MIWWNVKEVKFGPVQFIPCGVGQAPPWIAWVLWIGPLMICWAFDFRRLSLNWNPG